MRNAYLAFLAMGLFVNGCGDGNTAQVDNFINSLAQQTCDWEFRCCKDPEIKQLDGHRFAPTDSASCTPYRALALADQLYIDRLAVREGRLRVDPDRASACLSQMTNKQCNPSPGHPAPPIDPMAMDSCVNVFVGNTAVGAECIYSNECVDGAHCVSDMLAVGRGVCVPFQREGEICNGDTDCDPKVKELYCAKQDFKCHLRAKLGEACAYTVDDQGMNPALPMLLECDARIGNIYCDPISSTCRQLPTDGQACLSPLPPGVLSQCDADPALDLVCDHTGTTGPGNGGTCRAPGKLGADCTSIQCDKDLYCATSGAQRTCTALPSFGQPCSMSNYRCLMPYYCNWNKNPAVCDQPAAVGEDCTQATCDTGLYCPTNGVKTCKTQLPDGAVCTSSNECLSFDCAADPMGGGQVCKSAATGILCIGR